MMHPPPSSWLERWALSRWWWTLPALLLVLSAATTAAIALLLLRLIGVRVAMASILAMLLSKS